ncbi:hypothetical protein Hanom_Chr11g01036371 [Helianthus anomalus]
MDHLQPRLKSPPGPPLKTLTVRGSKENHSPRAHFAARRPTATFPRLSLPQCNCSPSENSHHRWYRMVLCVR